MHHSAFVQQEFSDEPANEQQTAGKPKHRLLNLGRGYSKAYRGFGRTSAFEKPMISNDKATEDHCNHQETGARMV